MNTAHRVLVLAILLVMHSAELQASELLRRARDPALVRQSGVEEYRFTYSPTFSNPLIARVTKRPGRITLRAVHFSGTGGYDPGRIMVDRTVAITPREWERIATLARTSRFWTLPEEADLGGMDGTYWVLEGSRADAQHLVARWSPTYQTRERDLQLFLLFGRYLISLSGIKMNLH